MKIFVFLFLFFTIATSQVKERQEKPFFEMLYFANINGNIENCDCGEPPLGGLDRIATILENYRSKNSDIIVIDGGDTFNTYPFIELDQAIVKAYQVIKPDIWILSEQELIEGSVFLSKNIKEELKKGISSNYKINGLVEPTPKEEVLLENTKITFHSYLSPRIINENADLILNKTNQFFQDIKNLKNNDFNILIMHGEEQDLVTNEERFKLFDLILTAHTQSDHIDLKSKPAIIGAGTDGEYVIHISLQKSNNKIIIKAVRRAVGLEIVQNPAIKKIIEQYKASIKN